MLFNNAGVNSTAGIPTTIGVNYLALRRLSEGLLPQIPSGGAIVNTASSAGNGWSAHASEIGELLALDGWDEAVAWTEAHRDLYESGTSDVYFFSKEAVQLFTLRFAIPARAVGVRVNSACPAPIDTPLLADFRTTMSDTIIDWNIDQAGGRLMSPREVAMPLAFLGSEAASYINGVNLLVDGGFMAAMTTGQADFSALQGGASMSHPATIRDDRCRSVRSRPALRDGDDRRPRPARSGLVHAPRTLGAILARSLEIGGDRTFLVLGDERVTHRAAPRPGERMAAALVVDLGVQPGDRVAIAMRNLPEWSISFFAAAAGRGRSPRRSNAFWNGPSWRSASRTANPPCSIADGERLERLIGHDDVLHGVTVVGTRLDDRKTTEPLPDAAPAAGTRCFDRPPLDAPVTLDPDDAAPPCSTRRGRRATRRACVGTHRNICAGRLRHRVRHRPQHGASRRADPAAAPHRRASSLMPVPLFHATGSHMNLVAQAWLGGTSC